MATQLNNTLEKMANLFITRYPLKKDIKTIASTWNTLFKDGKDVFSFGITYGWLEELMDLKYLHIYNYIPYHFRIGIAANKGYFGIEEEFLLKDAFNAFVKAENYFDILLNWGDKIKQQEEASGKKEFDKASYTQITNIKYEVAAFSRLTIISFYSFIECFVNSVGFSHLQRHRNSLNEDEKELLQGLRKGRYLPLKLKIEGFQKILRTDRSAIIITTDNIQMNEPFISFFNQYEELRNASIHYSPLKEQIWLKPDDWLAKARTFSKLSVQAGLEFWKSCFEDLEGPQYMGKLDYDQHYNSAKQRLLDIEKIQYELFKDKFENA